MVCFSSSRFYSMVIYFWLLPRLAVNVMIPFQSSSIILLICSFLCSLILEANLKVVMILMSYLRMFFVTSITGMVLSLFKQCNPRLLKISDQFQFKVFKLRCQTYQLNSILRNPKCASNSIPKA